MVAENVFVDLVLSGDTVVPVQFAYPSDNFTEDGLLLGGREHIARLGRTEADVIIFRLFSGDCRLVFDAYYGCGAHRQFVYAQTLGP